MSARPFPGSAQAIPIVGVHERIRGYPSEQWRNCRSLARFYFQMFRLTCSCGAMVRDDYRELDITSFVRSFLYRTYASSMSGATREPDRGCRLKSRMHVRICEGGVGRPAPLIDQIQCTVFRCSEIVSIWGNRTKDAKVKACQIGGACSSAIRSDTVNN